MPAGLPPLRPLLVGLIALHIGVGALADTSVGGGANTNGELAAGACPSHVVRPGDTLRRISEQYLGTRDRAGEIYAVNRAVIGSDPDIIVPGLRLTVPCGDPDAAPNDAALAEPAEASPPAMADLADPAPDRGPDRGPVTAPGSASGLSLLVRGDPPATADALLGPKTVSVTPPAAANADVRAVTDATSLMAGGPVHVLTGAPYLPYVDPAGGSGGMLTEIILAAFAQTDGAPLEVGFVNDRNAHLDIILPRGGFAFSFPWLMPDCATAPEGSRAQRLCQNYLSSDSLYEHVTEFFSRGDSRFATARTLADLTGARLCRPAGYPLEDLAEAGLLPAALDIVRTETPRDCLEALDSGEVDIASLDATLARAIVIGMELENPLVVLEPLTRIERMRAVALRGDPVGAAAIQRLNTGLAALVESGTWFEIVDRHLNGKTM